MTKVALLIGVSDYGLGFNSLPQAVKDVAAMQRILQHPDLGGFSEVDTLINPNPFAMQMAIEILFKYKMRERNDLALLFFSGHCINDPNNNLYFATRLTRKNPQGELVKSTTVSAHFWQDIMSESRSKQQVVILDCCFSNAFADVWSAKNYGYVDVKNQLSGEGRVILTASTSIQQQFLPHSGSNISNYTRYLVEGVETGAADFDRDQYTSVYELHQYAKRKAEATAATIEPQIYAVKASYNILLTKVLSKDLQVRSSKNVTKVTPLNPLTGVDEFALGDSLHPNSSHRVHPRVFPDLSHPQSLIGVVIATVVFLTGMIYGLYRWQDLQRLPMSEGIAADTNYQNPINARP